MSDAASKGPGMPTDSLPPVMVDLINSLSMAQMALDNLTMRVQTAAAYTQDLRRQANDPTLLGQGEPGAVSRATAQAGGDGRRVFGKHPHDGTLDDALDKATAAGAAAEAEAGQQHPPSL